MRSLFFLRIFSMLSRSRATSPNRGPSLSNNFLNWFANWEGVSQLPNNFLDLSKYCKRRTWFDRAWWSSLEVSSKRYFKETPSVASFVRFSFKLLMICLILRIYALLWSADCLASTILAVSIYTCSSAPMRCRFSRHSTIFTCSSSLTTDPSLSSEAIHISSF